MDQAMIHGSFISMAACLRCKPIAEALTQAIFWRSGETYIRGGETAELSFLCWVLHLAMLSLGMELVRTVEMEAKFKPKCSFLKIFAQFFAIQIYQSLFLLVQHTMIGVYPVLAARLSNLAHGDLIPTCVFSMGLVCFFPSYRNAIIPTVATACFTGYLHFQGAAGGILCLLTL